MSRLARPREVGLLTAVDTGGRGPGLHRFPYAIGERIAGDLTVTGHLAVGRLGHLYQVWSAREWCAYTCKILSPSMQRDRRALAALRREGAILRGVRHPNLVRGYGVGEFDGLPFVLIALGLSWATGSLAWLRRHIRVINIIGGVLLILVGLAMVTGLWQAMMSSLTGVINGFVPAL